MTNVGGLIVRLQLAELSLILDSPGGSPPDCRRRQQRRSAGLADAYSEGRLAPNPADGHSCRV
jgi:hypothetical protein